MQRLGLKARGWALRTAARMVSVLTPCSTLQDNHAPRSKLLADLREQPDVISKQLLLSPRGARDVLVKELDQLQGIEQQAGKLVQFHFFRLICGC